MVERVFLGWDRPLVTLAVDWLLARGDQLPRLLVVVPTSQSGRRLREALAEQAGALLAPAIVTPGSLLKTPTSKVAADWMERVAWVETLEAVAAWDDYQELFPQAPAEGVEWAGGLAGEMVQLRHALQENGLTLVAAARLLSGTVEAGRWEALGRLEQLMERKLQAWGLQSRSRVLANGVVLPVDVAGIVLVGITEMPPLLERAWLAWPGLVTVLIAAPEHESHGFSATGRPLECWTRRSLPWPDGATGSVRLVADPRQQASEALRVLTETTTASDEVALGSADTETGDELARAFTRHGWPAFHPAAKSVTAGLARWFTVWAGFAADPKLTAMADLLALPESSMLISGRRADLAAQLARLRNDWMMVRPDDLRQRIATATFRSESQQASAVQVLQAADALESWRAAFLREEFSATLAQLLNQLGACGPEAAAAASDMLAWLAQAAPLLRQVKRGPGFWFDLMLSAIPAPSVQPPEGRVLDVQGWLELLFEPGQHLLLCGMNEGKVPASNSGDPWLGEAAASHLGLTGNAERAARDAFLYQSMCEARRDHGRVDVICAKSGAGGEALLPSRLLLAADPDDLPGRVQFLFRGIEPPEAGLRWYADWKWQPRQVEVASRFSVTALTTYLACPFRYYLKHAVAMQRPEPDRVEWNARDFGTVAHEVMERWGRDPAARDLANERSLQAWFSAELDRIVSENFGARVPLAVRVQTEVLRQRLAWLAATQAASHADGWDVIEVEHKIEIAVGTAIVVGKIDRIDRHRGHGGLRVIDYKTGKINGIEAAHRRRITASSVLPAHLASDSPAVFAGEQNGKAGEFLWCNLQLPLYALAVSLRDAIVPTPCYFTLGATAADVALHEWSDFSTTDLAAASDCAAWIVAQITAGIFWPPAQKVQYDDFAVLAAGRSLAETVVPLDHGMKLVPSGIPAEHPSP
ncbi:MAG: PD-(D/E)XK nuclease family protein [Verrucomicrobiota bacterium]